MASKSYSRSKNSFRSRTESSSSDLFDEMLETSGRSDLKPPVPKLMAGLDHSVPSKSIKKNKPSYPKPSPCPKAAVYSYSNWNR